MSADLVARSLARSHIGSVRPINEDRVLNLSDRGLWAVADGMGGHAMGDIAAQAVVTTLTEFAARDLSADRLAAAVAEANRRVVELGREANRQCGSTVAGVWLRGSDATVFWAGDSRVYRHREGRATLLTHDHRVVQDLVDAGIIDAAAARYHPRAAVITRAVGAGPVLELATRVERAVPGDTFLICSDGLSDLVDDTLVEAALAIGDEGVADRLLEAALSAGGTDNISFVLVTIDAPLQDDRRVKRGMLHTKF